MFAFIIIFIANTIFITNNSEAREPKKRYFEFIYKVDIIGIPKYAKDIRVWIPYPVSTKNQRIVDVKLESPYPVALKYDREWGNPILYMKPNLADTDFTIILKFKILRYEDLHSFFNPSVVRRFSGNPGIFNRYLKPTKYDPILDDVRRFTTRATRGKRGTLDKIKGIYEFVLDKMEYNKKFPGWGEGNISRVCLLITEKGLGKGNCTDFHSLFTAMVRSIGVPAKFVMGYPLKSGDFVKGRVGGYHCWAEFFLPGYGWIPVDISEADKNPSKKDYFFGSIDENRVKFSEGRDIMLEPHQKGGRLNYFGPDPYIEVDGIEFRNFKRTISYRNIRDSY
jgi:transglutaminase-like putative cysteine protease